MGFPCMSMIVCCHEHWTISASAHEFPHPWKYQAPSFWSGNFISQILTKFCCTGHFSRGRQCTLLNYWDGVSYHYRRTGRKQWPSMIRSLSHRLWIFFPYALSSYAHISIYRNANSPLYACVTHGACLYFFLARPFVIFLLHFVP